LPWKAGTRFGPGTLSAAEDSILKETRATLGLLILTNLDDFWGDCCSTGGPSGAMPTDPLECFIQELQDLSTMNGDNGPYISAVLDDLPVQQRGEVASISM
jgi:hypothetical protein